jgi:asparagine synthase (glutamine-hydrolysing)
MQGGSGIGPRAPHLAQSGEVSVALTGRIFLRQGSALQTPADPARAVLDAYLASGRRMPGALEGSFALVVEDRRSGEWLLAVDRMGIERLCFGTAGQQLAFGTSALDVARALNASPRLNHQALYDYLLSHMVPAPGSVFAGVHKLQPATCAVVDRQGGVRTERYWSPQFWSGGSVDLDGLRAGLHSAVDAAVRRCQPDESTGAFLSGGLDSSTVAGVFAHQSARPVRTFSIGFGVESYDELEYVRIANRHFGCEGHELHVTANDIVENFDRIAAAYDEPFGNSSALPTYICARLAARHGVTHLLAGDGGDEIFGGNERYVRQRVFELYRRVPALLRRGVIEPLARAVPPEGGLMPLRKLRSYIDQARIPLPDRLETYNFVHREGAARVLHADFLAHVDPQANMRERRAVYESSPAALVDQLMHYDWQYTLADNDLRKVGTMCSLAGVRVSYPLLDPEVIALSLAVPAPLKVKGTSLRWFYKRAMTGFLPDQILTKSKHGFGLPFGVWLKTDLGLRELIHSHLDSLRARRIVNASFIDDLRRSHQDGDASFYGYPIWDLALLDAWLTAHRMTV